MRYHLSPIRIAIIEKRTDNTYWWGCREKRTLVLCYWECKLVKLQWKTVWLFLKNFKIKLLWRSHVSASLLTIPIIWKQSVFQWLNGQRKYGYIKNKKNIKSWEKGTIWHLLKQNGTWGKYGKWSNSEKDKYYLILFKCEI